MHKLRSTHNPCSQNRDCRHTHPLFPKSALKESFHIFQGFYCRNFVSIDGKLLKLLVRLSTGVWVARKNISTTDELQLFTLALPTLRGFWLLESATSIGCIAPIDSMRT